jgi:predicted NACHT family NTPase
MAVTLLELARSLLELTGENDMQPVPLVLSLSYWSNFPTKSEDWVVHEFVSKYQVPKCVDYRWLSEHRIALLLDSLDEVLSNKRAGCADAIHVFVDRIGTPGAAVYRSTKRYRVGSSSEAHSPYNHAGRSRSMTT